MPRPESPLDPDAGELQRFAHELRQVRARAGGPPYRVLARRAHFSAATLAKAADGTGLPSLAVTLAYVRACDGDVAGWEARWREVSARTEPGPPVSAAPHRTDDVPCPYPGPAPFGSADADLFAGRDGVLAELVAALDRHRLVALVGPSGCGKTSLLHAGLPAALGREVAVHALRPDRERPPARGDVVLVVDGAEFAALAPAEQARFADRVLAAVRAPEDRTRAVLVGSSGRGWAGHPELARAARVDVGPATVEELRAAVVHPAARSGCTVEGALVTQLVGEVAGQPGALALVALVMARTWPRRRGNALTLAGYRACGGLAGVLSDAAERWWADLPAGRCEAARAVLLRLVAAGGGAVCRDEFDAEPVLDELAAARLVVLDGDDVRPAHRSLPELWPRLREWVAVDREGLRVHRHLTDAARTWESLGRETDALYRGTRLVTARAWADGNGDRLNARERDFLRHSTAPPRGRRRLVAALLAAALVGATAVAVSVRTGPGPVRGSADADRTGRADLVGMVGGLRVWPNTGAFPGRPWGEPVALGPDLDPSLTRFADLDGDGRDDLVGIDRNGTLTGWRTDHRSSTAPWPVSAEVGREWDGDPAAIHFADLDGDGRAELIGVDTADDQVLRAWRNNGGFPDWPWDSPIGLGAGWVDVTTARFADLTGDGLADLIAVGDRGLRVWPNNGGFPAWPWGEPVDVGRAGAADPQFADLDGDGYADLVAVTGGGITVWRNGRTFPGTPWEPPVRVDTGGPVPDVVRFAELAGDA
ncbi:nSTAND1 domain-containing NTPase [Saccharothrix sp. Mg75]|uniref:nSTAND1 domain-containing NTPase n=1 Tax=Saccharothrix sp. Mg75 TaxID=3445357 RepID=UPI003EEC9EBB